MTYEKAIEVKNHIGQTVVLDGISLKTFVGPGLKDDLARVTTEYLSNLESDLDSYATGCSSNGLFSVYAIGKPMGNGLVVTEEILYLYYQGQPISPNVLENLGFKKFTNDDAGSEFESKRWEKRYNGHRINVYKASSDEYNIFVDGNEMSDYNTIGQTYDYIDSIRQ